MDRIMDGDYRLSIHYFDNSESREKRDKAVETVKILLNQLQANGLIISHSVDIDDEYDITDDHTPEQLEEIYAKAVQ